VRAGDVNVGRLQATLVAAAEAGPGDFAELLLTPGVGARMVRSLAMAAEIVHGAPCRFLSTRHDFRSPAAARTGTRFRSRPQYTTKRSGCSKRRLRRPGSAARKSSPRCSVSTIRSAGSKAM